MDSQDNRYYTNLMSHGEVNFDSQLYDSEYDLNQQFSEPVVSVRDSTKVKVTKKAQRSRNFTIEKDLLLISAWLNISMDAVQENQQKKDTYWQRIHDYFHPNRTFNFDRSQNSLIHRWSGMQLEVNKFCGFYAQINGMDQSGRTEQDKVIILFQSHIYNHFNTLY